MKTAYNKVFVKHKREGVKVDKTALLIPYITKYVSLNVFFVCAFCLTSAEKKMHFFLSVNVFSTKVLIGDTIFYVSNWRRDRHFTWSSEPREGLACCSAKGVPSFLGYFKTLSIGPAPGIGPATSRSAVDTLYRLS